MEWMFDHWAANVLLISICSPAATLHCCVTISLSAISSSLSTPFQLPACKEPQTWTSGGSQLFPVQHGGWLDKPNHATHSQFALEHQLRQRHAAPGLIAQSNKPTPSVLHVQFCTCPAGFALSCPDNGTAPGCVQLFLPSKGWGAVALVVALLVVSLSAIAWNQLPADLYRLCLGAGNPLSKGALLVSCVQSMACRCRETEGVCKPRSSKHCHLRHTCCVRYYRHLLCCVCD